MENKSVEKKQNEPPAKESEERPALTDLSDFLERANSALPLLMLGIFVMGGVYFVYFARPFLMPVILAVLLNYLLKPVVRFLTNFKIRESLGAFIVMLIFFSILGFSISQLAQPASDWFKKAPENFQVAEGKIRRLLRPAVQISKAAETVENILATPEAKLETNTTTVVTNKKTVENAPKTEIPEKVPQVQVKTPPHLATDALSLTGSFLAGALETIVLLYFLLAAGDLFMNKVVKILPTLHDKKKAVEIAHELQHNISTFLFTITVINTCLGLLVGLAMKIVGMPNPILWGVVAGLLNFIPYFGPISGVVVLLLAGLVTFESLVESLLPPLIYLSLHALESNVFTPMILGKRLTLNPVMIFISLIFWTWIWGIAGALLSVPILMMVKIFCDHFKPLSPIGELLGD
ncbi:MAG: AI-2E family transporter [Verrucomicrobiota bacterium]